MRAGIVMQKILNIIKRELVEVLPPTVFFFIAFNVIIISKKLMLEQYGIKFSGFVNAAVGALIVGKALLVADDIKYINKYPDKPLIYNIVWKTFVYLLVTLLVQYIEEIIPLWVKYHSLKIAIERGWEEIIWPHFWAVHIVFVFLLSLYVSFRELARAIGEKKFLQIFLGIELSNDNAQV
jgi:hypothetical protein